MAVLFGGAMDVAIVGIIVIIFITVVLIIMVSDVVIFRDSLSMII